MKDPKKFTKYSINKFMNSVWGYACKVNKRDNLILCPITESILYMLINDAYDHENKSSITTKAIGDSLGKSKYQVRKRLKFLAKHSLITCSAEWKKSERGIKRPQTIRINPKLIYILTYGAKQNLTLIGIKSFIDDAERRDQSVGDFQGFKYDIPYGDKEPMHMKDISVEFKQMSYEEFSQTTGQAGDQMLEGMEKLDREKANRTKENKFWREASARYANQAAVCWKMSQTAHGYGDAMPNWSGETRTMANQAKSERSELVKTLETYGGKVAALSWYIYCTGIQEIDNKTLKPKYDPQNPHRQFITADRKPSQYSKHFNSIIMSPDYKLYSGKKWSDLLPNLERLFGDSLNLLPRGKTSESSNPTGSVPGIDSGPSLEDLK